MPIYEYRCESCDQHTELVQKFSDAPAVECPHCKQPHLKKLISAAAFHLKGSGWYVTDFKEKPQNAEQKTQKSSENKSDIKEATSPAEETPSNTKKDDSTT